MYKLFCLISTVCFNIYLKIVNAKLKFRSQCKLKKQKSGKTYLASVPAIVPVRFGDRRIRLRLEQRVSEQVRPGLGGWSRSEVNVIRNFRHLNLKKLDRIITKAQLKLLNVITLGYTKSDNNNRMITKTHDFCLVCYY